MAAHTAIADVGTTLVSLLEDRIGPVISDDEIVLGSPGDEGAGEDFRLTVYLYDVRENEHLSNDRAASNDPRLGDAALVLDLHYLVTALPKAKRPNDNRTTKSADQHTILGRAMQVLADNAIVRKPDLDEDLGRTETISISIESTSRSELLDVWSTFEGVAYQPSVSYVVSPVVIESRRTADDRRVVETEFDEYTYAPVHEDPGDLFG